MIWMIAHLKPHRWYKYTDVVSFEQTADDVKVGFVLWENAKPVVSGLLPEDVVSEPAISSDGTRMVYSRSGKDGSGDLFLRRWDGTSWSSMVGSQTSKNFQGIYGFGPDDVYAVGNYGAIVRYNGTEWVAIESMTTQQKDLCKNAFALGLVFWLFDRPLDSTLAFYEKKFAKRLAEVIGG